jgi:predicted nuclease with TOPRIM domain
MAREFHEQFGLGNDAESIASVDADGVALAAIQGLSQRLDEENARLREKLDHRDDRIDDLEAQNDALRERNDELERRLETVEDHLGLGGRNGKPAAADD